MSLEAVRKRTVTNPILLAYSINGLVAGEIYIPGEDGGYYSSGDGLIFTFLMNLCLAGSLLVIASVSKSRDSAALPESEDTADEGRLPWQIPAYLGLMLLALVLGLLGIARN